MAVTQTELDSFHHFATERLKTGEAELGWDELFVLWDSTRYRAAIDAAVREGLADVDAGRHESAEAATEEIRAECGPGQDLLAPDEIELPE